MADKLSTLFLLFLVIKSDYFFPIELIAFYDLTLNLKKFLGSSLTMVGDKS